MRDFVGGIGLRHCGKCGNGKLRVTPSGCLLVFFGTFAAVLTALKRLIARHFNCTVYELPLPIR